MVKPRRPVVGGYCLERWNEGHTFFILVSCPTSDKIQHRTDNGVLDGNVREIGWDARYIVVKRYPLSPPDDWVAVDTKENMLLGPVATRGELDGRLPALANIKVQPVSTVW
jgi:hypothetical protein